MGITVERREIKSECNAILKILSIGKEYGSSFIKLNLKADSSSVDSWRWV